MAQTPAKSQSQKGSIVVTILIIMLFLSTMVLGAVLLANENMNRAWSRLLLLQAQYAAESGADYAITTLNNVNASFTGTSSDVQVLSGTLYRATFAVTVATSGSNTTITSTGKVYKPKTATSPTYTRTIRVTAQRTAGSTASGMMGTNSIVIDSSVKNVNANNIFANLFVKASKNTTNLNFSSLTVAGKDSASGSANCSIEGSGTLNNYPSTSKATIDVAYNNCLTPPGNTSNTNFNVTANDNTVNTIQSLYIPWAQYMDSTYQSSPTGCADWTASGSTVTIPSTGNTKKTHYPDAGSGISSSCGTNGVIKLQDTSVTTYNITDNVHIRADLCSYASPCHPKFDNTSGSLKFMFIEGNAYFSGIDTSPGSAPIVIETFGANSASIPSSKCNGISASIYLGKDGSNGTNAPQVYLLTQNNICLDSTKFAANPALAGLGGQNLYISTNSGTPYDLYLNTTFPTNQIPINLAWRATGYERL